MNFEISLFQNFRPI